MRKYETTISEVYWYDSYAEFCGHYAEMLTKGFKPRSNASTPEFYANRNLDLYVATYDKTIYE